MAQLDVYDQRPASPTLCDASEWSEEFFTTRLDALQAAGTVVTRPIEGLSLERELVIVTVSRSTTPVEIQKIAQLASRYEWQ